MIVVLRRPQVVDMFSDHPDAYVEFLGSRYRRKEGIKRLYSERHSRCATWSIQC
jgi:hypothetical protein